MAKEQPSALNKMAKRTARFDLPTRQFIADLCGVHMTLGVWAFNLFERGKSLAEVKAILNQLVEHVEVQRKGA
jgi:hypothetical protein